jgi:type IV pilus assembly protein PilN
MIRINLLQSEGGSTSSGGTGFVALAGVLVLLLVGALYYVQSSAQADYDRVRDTNRATKKKIDALKKETKEVEKLELEKEQLERQKQVLQGLVEGKNGPINMLYEMSEMLRVEDDSEKKLAQKNKGWNPEWDPKRMWIASFVEKNRVVRIQGFARSNEDVAEFHHRLESSRHFVEVTLRLSEVVSFEELGGVKFVKFTIDMVALYGKADVERYARGDLSLTKKKKRR